MAGEEDMSGDYLQLRKDLMKVPKQFYLNKESLGPDGEHPSRVGDYFKYANGEGEGALSLKQQLSSSKKDALARAPVRAPATTE